MRSDWNYAGSRERERQRVTDQMSIKRFSIVCVCVSSGYLVSAAHIIESLLLLRLSFDAVAVLYFNFIVKTFDERNDDTKSDKTRIQFRLDILCCSVHLHAVPRVFIVSFSAKPFFKCKHKHYLEALNVSRVIK